MKDKAERLAALCSDLMEVFLVEAEPTRWNGAGADPVETTVETRGARNWDIKNANQVGALTARAMDLLDRVRGFVPVGALERTADPADADIARFEKQARQALEKMKDRAPR